MKTSARKARVKKPALWFGKKQPTGKKRAGKRKKRPTRLQQILAWLGKKVKAPAAWFVKGHPAGKERGGKRKKKPTRLQRTLLWSGRIAVGGVLILTGMLAAGTIWPSLGAEGADLLRSIFGNKVVARLEMVLFQVQDTVHEWRYDLGFATPPAPWESTPFAELAPTPTSRPQPTVTAGQSATAAPSQEAMQVPTITPNPRPWPPEALSPLGTLAGEGIWSAYIWDSAGETVAYRTYLRPDPNRPWTVVAVVAMDLTRTRLHFVLGSEEPFSPNGPKRTGAMPAEDKAPGVLLAMFNGGFKGRHGEFGAMADGVVALPARTGLGTMVIFKDGRVWLGEWGPGFTTTEDMLAWRQNGPLVIQNGEINPRIYNNSPQDWGYTVYDVSPTWRSGVGISPDGKTLYYFCGPSLTMEGLARAMQASGVEAAIQLDINEYWVLFTAVRAEGQKLVLNTLFPDTMKENIDRYLWPYTRDYFYVTVDR